ncbi:hypothetical protein LAZ67_4003475 [Cordylochernes scorpioides]|uniref:BCNT-C domain-containing protein n=1 Tax=Cordylochernes scorpioides TaxID=51811 RepID=A0ABY6KH48_9ARAC|nr:hypothetical protein LAZ67_4003475 [Cordylochernes scorpioides]
MQRKDGSGRPRDTTEWEDRAIVRMAVAAPETTLSTIQRVTGTQVSKMTINRRLRERNLRARRPLRCLPLTPVHRQVRLQWCRERSTWNCADWGRIVFSDESRFLLCPDDRRKRVWRRPGQRVDPGLSVEHHTGPQQGVMVWGAISFDSMTPLVVIPGTLTAQRAVVCGQTKSQLDWQKYKDEEGISEELNQYKKGKDGHGTTMSCLTNMPRRSRPLIGRNTAASRRYRNAIAIETPLQSETRRALRRLRYSEARVAAAQTMQVPVQRIQLWTHKPFSGLQYNTHIDYKADSSVDIGQMSRKSVTSAEHSFRCCPSLTDAYEETWTHPDIEETIAEFECSPRPLLDAECGQLGLLLHQLGPFLLLLLLEECSRQFLHRITWHL